MRARRRLRRPRSSSPAPTPAAASVPGEGPAPAERRGSAEAAATGPCTNGRRTTRASGRNRGGRWAAGGGVRNGPLTSDSELRGVAQGSASACVSARSLSLAAAPPELALAPVDAPSRRPSCAACPAAGTAPFAFRCAASCLRTKGGDAPTVIAARGHAVHTGWGEVAMRKRRAQRRDPTRTDAWASAPGCPWSGRARRTRRHPCPGR